MAIHKKEKGMATPLLTEVERLTLENYALRYNLLHQQMLQIQGERAAFIRLIEQAYPGYEWRDGSGLIEKE
jgi:hypothetical protein